MRSQQLPADLGAGLPEALGLMLMPALVVADVVAEGMLGLAQDVAAQVDQQGAHALRAQVQGQQQGLGV